MGIRIWIMLRDKIGSAVADGRTGVALYLNHETSAFTALGQVLAQVWCKLICTLEATPLILQALHLADRALQNIPFYFVQDATWDRRSPS